MNKNKVDELQDIKDFLNFELWLELSKKAKNQIPEDSNTLSESQVDAIIQNQGTFMIDHLSEWNGGWPLIQPDPNALPIGCAQKPLANQNSAFPQESSEPIQMNLEPIKDSNITHKKPCSCDSWFLFQNGCKCGGI